MARSAVEAREKCKVMTFLVRVEYSVARSAVGAREKCKVMTFLVRV